MDEETQKEWNACTGRIFLKPLLIDGTLAEPYYCPSSHSGALIIYDIASKLAQEVRPEDLECQIIELNKIKPLGPPSIPNHCPYLVLPYGLCIEEAEFSYKTLGEGSIEHMIINTKKGSGR